MKRLACLLLAAALPPAASAAGPARVKVAVMDVKNVQGVTEGTATILTDIVVSEVAKARLEVVSKGDIAAMIGFEKEKQMLGCSDDSKCLAEVGGALGVDYMLTGQVGLIGSRYRISLLLVDSRRAKVAGRSARFCDRNEDALAQAAQETVTELLALVPRPEAGAAPPPPRPAAATRPAPAPALAQAAAPAPVAEVAASAAPNRTAAWITYGASGAFIVAGAIFGIVAESRYNDLKSLQGSPSYQQAWDSKAQEIRNLARVADISYAVGLVGAGVGTVLWFTAGPGEPRKVAVGPLLGDGQVGLAAAGQF